MKDIKILISSVLIIISFFIGYFFAISKVKEEYKNKKDKINYVNLEILKTKIKISKNQNTQILVNGEKILTNEIKLNK